MIKIILKEEQLSLINIDEDVFANKVKGRGKNKLNLSYNKRASDNRTINFGNLLPFDIINTGKMDQNNADTFIVPLKGGINSYNITSIKGTEIMHYFKNKRRAEIDADLNGDGQKETYELLMDDPEYNEFFRQFYNKVNNVVSYVTNNLYKESKGKIKFSGVSIYPVPSSSDFNEITASQMQQYVNLNGLPVIKINRSLFKKDLSNLQKDEEFINNNKSYYSSKMMKYGDDPTTHEQYVDRTLKDYSYKEDVRNEVRSLIDEYNMLYDKMDSYYLQYKDRRSKTFGQTLKNHYINLYKKFNEIINVLKRGRKKAIESDEIYGKLKGTKSQVEERKTKDIWSIVKPLLRGTGTKPLPMHRLQINDFQIKSLPNNVRMGMKNYFSNNPEMVQQEMEKIKGTVFVIFDDNISGGATLSDICMQAKQLGIEYMIPITFGEMQTKYNLGRGMQINKPKNGRFEKY